MSGATPLILDVDTGIDDALAITLAALSPEAELVMVSTVAGNTSLANATKNSLDVLDWIGAGDVPVHQGATHPLIRDLQDARHVHGNTGVGGANLPASSRAVGSDRGPAALIRLAFSRPGEITLVCLGPLTNLAIALNVEPRLPEMLRGLVVMGGAYTVPGNITPSAEFNIYSDPEAAAQVFSAAFDDFVAIGLDVTHRAAISETMWQSARRSEGAPAQLLATMLESWFADADRPAAYIHDAMAVAAALDPMLVHCDRHAVTVEIGEETRGRTVLSDGRQIKVAKQVDAERFLGTFLNRLGIVEPARTSTGAHPAD